MPRSYPGSRMVKKIKKCYIYDMSLRKRLGELLSRHTDLIDSVYLFDNELKMTKKYTSDEWLECAQEFIFDSDDLIREYSKKDNSFVVFQNKQYEKKAEMDNLASASRVGLDLVRRTPHKEIDPPIDLTGGSDCAVVEESFSGYFNKLREINGQAELLYWLDRKYGSVNPNEIEVRKEKGVFGNFIFELDTNQSPIALRYSTPYGEKTINLPKSRLVFFFIIMDACYYSGQDISFKEIGERMPGDRIRGEEELRKFASEINKKLNRVIGIDKFICSCGKDRPRHYKVSN